MERLVVACDGVNDRPAMTQGRDLRTIKRRRTPNDALAAPAGVTAAEPDLIVPCYAVPVERLKAALREVADAGPRTKLLAEHQALDQLVFVQRSRFFGFKDRIEAQVVTLPEGVSAILYSRALTGGWDLGENRKRLGRWLAGLDAALNPGS